MFEDIQNIRVYCAFVGVAALCFMITLFIETQKWYVPLVELPPPVVAAGQGHPSHPGQININTADEEELMELYGIGEARAQAIIQYREEHGPFRRVEDLTRVKGIGKGIVKRIVNDITVGGG